MKVLLNISSRIHNIRQIEFIFKIKSGLYRVFRLLNKLINKFLINYNHKDFILKLEVFFAGFGDLH